MSVKVAMNIFGGQKNLIDRRGLIQLDYDEFRREYLCEWLEPSEEYLFAYKLLIKYHFECERYDQTVCSMRDKRGVARPANRWEASEINRHTMIKHRELLSMCYGIDDKTFKQAKQDVLRLSLKGFEQEYDRLFREGE